MPFSPPAQRLYAEGLELLQRRDAQGAVERLTAAAEADRNFPGVWLALARAYQLLGFERQAEEAALNAVQRSHGLPERERLITEATYLHFVRRRQEAVEPTQRQRAQPAAAHGDLGPPQARRHLLSRAQCRRWRGFGLIVSRRDSPAA